jgi:hypothetical protein
MKVFELEATFRAEPPDEPQAQRFYLKAPTPEEAIRGLQSYGAYDVKIIRELSEEERRRFRYLRSAEL